MYLLLNMKLCFQPKSGKPVVYMKCNTTDVETQQEGNIFPHFTLNLSKSMKQNTAHNSIENGYESKDINTYAETECNENISRNLDPLSNGNRAGRLCSARVNRKSLDNLPVTERDEALNYKENIQDVKVVQTSEGNICSRWYLRVPPLSAVDGVTRRLSPETSWSQKKDKVYITIHLAGVQQYKCCVSSSHLIFM